MNTRDLTTGVVAVGEGVGVSVASVGSVGVVVNVGVGVGVAGDWERCHQAVSRQQSG